MVVKMNKNELKNIKGVTLVEMMIGVVIASIMMAAMYTTYSVVNNSYSQVVDRAKISRSGRDVVEMLIRDVRMAGFHYFAGENTQNIPLSNYLQYIGGTGTVSIQESHDPLIVKRNTLGYNGVGSIAGTAAEKHDTVNDKCCDRIHIVYGDFDQNSATQPYKKYRITYYALPITNEDGSDPRYGVYKTKEGWNQPIGALGGAWIADCSECYTGELVRDHLDDMEFIVFDKKGKRLLNTATREFPQPDDDTFVDLYKISVVDIRLTFRSNKPFYSKVKERIVTGLGDRNRPHEDRYFRESVVVTVHTRNIN